MNNEYPINTYITSKSKRIFGFKKDEFEFNGGDFHRLFRLRQKELIKGINILTQDDQLEYMKCYAVAVGNIIKKFFWDKPETAEGEDFQSQFFFEGITHLKNYYESDPEGHFFHQFPDPPETEKEEKSRGNWLFQQAEWFILTQTKQYLPKIYASRCIDYEVLKAAKKEYQLAKSRGEDVDPLNYDDFRDKDCWKESAVEDFEILLEHSAAGGVNDEDYLNQIDDLIDRYKIEESNTSVDLDSMVHRLRLDHSSRIKQLYSIFSTNDIEEISSTEMWEVKHSELRLDEIEMIFKALDFGYPLSLQGKQFLMMQYLLIAIGALRNYEGFSIGEGRITIHTPEQMVFLATVIGQAYTYFNNKYVDQIIKPLSKIAVKNKKEEEQISVMRKEKLFSILSKFIRDNINNRFQEYKSKKSQLTLFAMDLTSQEASISMDYILELDKVFGDEENFRKFIKCLIIHSTIIDISDDNVFYNILFNIGITNRLSELINYLFETSEYELQIFEITGNKPVTKEDIYPHELLKSVDEKINEYLKSYKKDSIYGFNPNDVNKLEFFRTMKIIQTVYNGLPSDKKLNVDILMKNLLYGIY